MRNIISVAACPSSGSTLIADFLDSLPNCLCGPETGLLAVASQSDISVRNDIICTKISLDPCKSILKISSKRLHELGLSQKLVSQAWNNSNSTSEFLEYLTLRYKAFRGKAEDSYFCEKTPTNYAYSKSISSITSVLGTIFIVRNPYYTITSMTARGYSLSQSLSAWVYSATLAIDLLAIDQAVTIIKYEDFVLNPAELILDSLNSLGVDTTNITPKTLLEKYKTNPYRKFVSPKNIKSWKINTYGDVKSANTKVAPDVQVFLSNHLSAKVNSKVIDLSDESKDLTLLDLMNYFGYEILPVSEYFPDKNNLLSALGCALKFSVLKVKRSRQYIKHLYLRPRATVKALKIRCSNIVVL